MNFSGSHELNLSQKTVWNSLRDVDVLAASIPGCESFEQIESDGESYKAVVATRVGPMKARFAGNMNIEDADPPNSYKMVGSGSAGNAGAARGEVAINLRAVSADKIILEFDASIAMTGRMAQIGGKMINSTAEAFAREFFDNLSRNAAAEVENLTQAEAFKVPMPSVFSGKRGIAILAIAAVIVWGAYKLMSG